VSENSLERMLASLEAVPADGLWNAVCRITGKETTP
jgi:hypothetical protein